MTSSASLVLFFCAATAPILVPASAAAQSPAAAAHAAAVPAFRVTSTRQDPATGQLVIVGTGFRPDVVAALNGARLTLVSVLGHELRADLPALLPGTYRLTLDQRRGRPQYFVVTVGGGTGVPGPQGPIGPPGPAGPAGPAGAAGGLTVTAANGALVGTVVSYGMGQPSIVALQDHGVWLGVPLAPDGIVATSYYALYADDACGTAPFVPLESNPAPFLRLLQVVTAGDPTAYYAGNPMTVQAFRSLSPLGRPGQCEPAGNGWEQPMLAGPLRTVDVSRFPAPLVIK